MVNEAVLKIETELPINMTCSSSVTLKKGSICKMSDLNTAALSDGNEDYVAGIVQSDVVGNTGMTTAPVFRGGYFLIYASGSITAGQAVSTTSEAPNCVKAATKTAVGGKTLGIAMENHSGAASPILVQLKPGCNTNAYS